MRYPMIEPESVAFEILLRIWGYLLKKHPNHPPDLLSQKAVDIAAACSDVPLDRLRLLSGLANFTARRTRAAKLDNIGG